MAVERRLPGTVVVQLTERRPLAVWQNQGKFALIDRDGQVVANQDPAKDWQRFATLPLVVGAGAPAEAAALLDALTGAAGAALARGAAVRVGERRWNLQLRSGLDVMLPEGAEPQALARLMELQAHDALLDRPLAPSTCACPTAWCCARRRPGPGPAPAPEAAGMNALNRPDPGALEPAERLPRPAPRPRPLRAGPIGVLDIGSTKIACLIGRADGEGGLRVAGAGLQRSRGVRAGGIADLDEAERAIRAAVAQAEEMADSACAPWWSTSPAASPKAGCSPCSGRWAGARSPRPTCAAWSPRAAPAPPRRGRETIHVLPAAFAVDDEPGVADPRGHHCDTLSARLHVVDASRTALRNLGAAVAAATSRSPSWCRRPMASGLACLVDDERELGAP